MTLEEGKKDELKIGIRSNLSDAGATKQEKENYAGVANDQVP